MCEEGQGIDAGYVSLLAVKSCCLLLAFENPAVSLCCIKSLTVPCDDVLT